jgi:endonuclease YncB( thermonuclease family)
MKLNRSLAAAVVSLIVCVSALAQKMVFQARVIDVIDGSTVVVESQSKTNFVVKCQATRVPQLAEPYADYSRQRLSDLVRRQMVTVEYTGRNAYGQLLGTIYVNEEDICRDQIAVGLAWFDPQEPNNLKTSTRELYARSEEDARRSGTGVWTTSVAAAANSNVLNNGVTSQATTLASDNQSANSSVVAPNTSNSGAIVDVRGYFRKDGTYVAPHKRTAPDARFDDNWTTVGNVNPYTGKPGTKSWFARNWWIFPTVGALIGTTFFLHRSTTGGIPCNDGTISQAQNRQGACSHHGGIR